MPHSTGGVNPPPPPAPSHYEQSVNCLFRRARTPLPEAGSADRDLAAAVDLERHAVGESAEEVLLGRAHDRDLRQDRALDDRGVGQLAAHQRDRVGLCR